MCKSEFEHFIFPEENRYRIYIQIFHNIFSISISSFTYINKQECVVYKKKLCIPEIIFQELR